MREISAQAFVNLFIKNSPLPIAAAHYSPGSTNGKLIITSRLNSQIKLIFNKPFSIMKDGTVFFCAPGPEESTWQIDSDIKITHEGKVLFDIKNGQNADQFFQIVKLNVPDEKWSEYVTVYNEVQIARSILPLIKF